VFFAVPFLKVGGVFGMQFYGYDFGGGN